MSVSLYYWAGRPTELTELEAAAVEHIVASRAASFPFQDEEGLFLYGGRREPDEVLAGSTKMPLDLERVLPVIEHTLDALTEVRRALPGTQWRVHLDDFDVPWDEDHGFVLPGMRDGDPTADGLEVA
ncbi:hypothetical protein ACFV9W_01720 [Streptomyces sp. NPDC059897]|uniref:hypothetical protein n=1 Tax=Streptomyces sp. NPDC059897 TaxID=3346994 RepID=UPI0036581E78